MFAIAMAMNGVGVLNPSTHPALFWRSIPSLPVLYPFLCM